MSNQNVNPKELENSLRQLEQQLTRETHDLHTKEEELQKMHTLEGQLKTEIPVLERKLHELKEKLRGIEYAKPKLNADIINLKKKGVETNNTLTRIHKSHEDSLRKIGGKLVK